MHAEDIALRTVRDPLERFLAQVEITESCWLWSGRLESNGYAKFRPLGRRGSPTTTAHRYAYSVWIGTIPDGWQVDHVKARGCSNRHCVNPDHLEAVPPAENNRRSTSPSALNALVETCPQGHPYDSENTYIHNHKRHCKTCRRVTSRLWKQQQRELVSAS